MHSFSSYTLETAYQTRYFLLGLFQVLILAIGCAVLVMVSGKSLEERVLDLEQKLLKRDEVSCEDACLDQCTKCTDLAASGDPSDESSKRQKCVTNFMVCVSNCPNSKREVSDERLDDQLRDLIAALKNMKQ